MELSISSFSSSVSSLFDWAKIYISELGRCIRIRIRLLDIILYVIVAD